MTERNEAAVELTLHIVNTDELYRQYTQPTINNLRKHYKRGKFDRSEAQKSLIRLATNGAKAYAKEYGPCTFTAQDRADCADMLYDNFREEIEE